MNIFRHDALSLSAHGTLYSSSIHNVIWILHTQQLCKGRGLGRQQAMHVTVFLMIQSLSSFSISKVSPWLHTLTGILRFAIGTKKYCFRMCILHIVSNKMNRSFAGAQSRWIGYRTYDLLLVSYDSDSISKILDCSLTNCTDWGALAVSSYLAIYPIIYVSVWTLHKNHSKTVYGRWQREQRCEISKCARIISNTLHAALSKIILYM